MSPFEAAFKAEPRDEKGEEGKRALEAIKKALPELQPLKNDFVLEIKYRAQDRQPGVTLLCFKFKKETDEYQIPRSRLANFFGQVSAVLTKHNLELGSELSSDDFWLRELTVDGKTNWRRWLPHPEKFSREQQALLDELASEIGQQEGYDKYQKFFSFVGLGLQSGLLTKKEYDDINRMTYEVVNG